MQARVESEDGGVENEPGRQLRKVRYSAAMSLDGYIAGPNEEFDWIPMHPKIDFGAMMGM